MRQPRIWLYLDPSAEHEFQSTVEAKPVDSGENIVVLIPEDKGVFYRVETGNNRAACTNAVQTYVDLTRREVEAKKPRKPFFCDDEAGVVRYQPMNAEPRQKGTTPIAKLRRRDAYLLMSDRSFKRSGMP